MKSGLGIRPELFSAVDQFKPDLGFLEAHSENYFGQSLARDKLLALRKDYPVSLHGVGLSLGRADDLDLKHLTELKGLVDAIEPLFVSEHLAWSAYAHRHVPDLLPLTLSHSALDIMCEHVDRMQSMLNRQVLVENPSNYLLFDELQIPEPEFLNELARRTGCGILLDVNNVFVSANNLQRDPETFLTALNSQFIHQYHLAGHTPVERAIDGTSELILIDTHNHRISDAVWNLFNQALEQHGSRPTLIEWDSDFPEFSVLLEECQKANQWTSSTRRRTNTINRDDVAVVPASTDIDRQQQSFLDAIFKLETKLPAAIPAHQHRLWVYQNNVFGALQDYLAEVFPATRGVVGNDFFKQMAQSHIQRAAPTHGNIHDYGSDFALTTAHIDGLEALPYLSDLIWYEWAQHAAYYASTGKLMMPDELAHEQLLSTPVRLNGSVSVINSSFPVFEIHRQSVPGYDGEVAIDLSQSQDCMLVFKRSGTVEVVRLSESQRQLINAIKEHSNLLQAIDALHGSLSKETLSESLSMVFEYQLLAHDATSHKLAS